MKLSATHIRACAVLSALALTMAASSLALHSNRMATALSAETAGTLTEISIDDGVTNCLMGPPRSGAGQPGFGWVNKLTPSSYPATLRSITIGFNRRDVVVDLSEIYRIVIFKDPEMDGPSNNQQPDLSFLGGPRGAMGIPRGTDAIATFNLITPVTIESGSFVVGAMDIFGVANFPAFFDIPGKSTPAGSDSFFTTNAGKNWTAMSDFDFGGAVESCAHPGSFLIRATVESDPVDVLMTASTIKDPLAVEPWSVCVNAAIETALVTNYVSDNLTVIDTSDNSFQNVAVGDGPGGTPDGPFGAVCSRNDRFYVTLFGSNTIPSKEFPIDYSTVGSGRVLVVDASGATLLQISVGKGPMFPALLPDQSRLYVPCAGDNRVDVINTATNEKIAEIPVGNNPSSCTSSLTGSKVYVTNFGDGTISIIDTATNQRVKDIAVPDVPTPNISESPMAASPWKGAISPSNGNLYITYWGTANDAAQNGAIIEIDTCSDEFVSAIIDPAVNGTPAGSDGSSGIPAPGGPLARDEGTGVTTEAGGGGGGPFGIVFCPIRPSDLSPSMYFTNDGPGSIGVIDSRINQLVSAPLLASCTKPRGIDCARISGVQAAYTACGQPDNCVLVITAPDLPENLADVPVIESVTIGNKVTLTGRGFFPFPPRGLELQVFAPGTRDCLTFSRDAKLKKQNTLIKQKGPLTDGRRLADLLQSNLPVVLRVVSPERTARISLHFAQAP